MYWKHVFNPLLSIDHTDPAECTNCYKLLSIKHILTECISYDQTQHSITYILY